MPILEVEVAGPLATQLVEICCIYNIDIYF